MIKLQEELGDVLLQVVFHAALAEKREPSILLMYPVLLRIK